MPLSDPRLTSEWKRVRREMLEAASWRCEGCGRAGRLAVHHRHHLRRGGPPFDPENLIVLCGGCHLDRHRRATDPAWGEMVAELRAR